MRRIVLVLLYSAISVMSSAFASSPSPAPRPLTSDSLTLTLDQATAYALEHSRTIAMSDFDIAKARAKVDEVLGNYYPTLGAGLTAAYLSDVPMFALPTGQPGRYTFIPLGAHANYDARLTLTQVLYSGGRITNGLRMAELGQTVTADSLTRKKQNLVYDVRRAFNSVVMMDQLMELTRQSEQRALDHLKTVESLYDAGFVSKYDRLRTQVQVDNIAPQIIKLETGLRLALDGFRLTTGMPLDQPVRLVGETRPGTGDEPSEADAVRRALASRPELRQVDAAFQVYRLNRAMTRASYYPTVAGSAAYDFKHPTSMSGSGWGSNLTLALGLNYTIFDGMKTRAQLRQIDCDIRKLELIRDFARDGVALEVKEAVAGMQSAQAFVAAGQRSIAAAEEGVKLAETRYGAGQDSNLDVLDAQLALFQTQVNRLTALRDYDEARARLDKAIGE